MDAAADAPQRRRGAALESALLEAAWDELDEKGYDAFTIESVAERAKTSRAVIYRRWPTKPELITAAILHSRASNRIEAPDTGSLRGDLIELLHRVQSAGAGLALLVIARLGSYYAESGKSFADLRAQLTAGHPSPMSAILQRAVERGEIDAERVTPRIAELPVSLLRHHFLMTFQPMADDEIEAIVDELTLPLLQRR